MIHGHGGNIYEVADILGCSATDIIDMSSNVSPIGTVPGLRELLEEHLDDIIRLPDVDSHSLRAGFAESLDLNKNNVLAGNGTTEFIYMIPPALKVKKALVVGPTYSDYADACRAFGVDVTYCLAHEENDFEPPLKDIQSRLSDVDTVFVCNPNNPTGQFIQKDSLNSIVSSRPEVRFVIDESYLPFVLNWEDETFASGRADNVIVLHSFSKIFGIPGLRLGFLVASRELIDAFTPFKCPWSVNSLAQTAGSFLASQKSFVQSVAKFVQQERRAFLSRIKRLNSIHVFPGAMHFMLCKLRSDMKAPELFRAMAEQKILIRDCSNFEGLFDRFFRIALRDSEANKRCADVLTKVLT